MTNSHNLSPREKLTIDSILSNAEEEIKQTERYQTIRNIDEKCRAIWPEWAYLEESPPKMIIRSNRNQSFTQQSLSPKQISQDEYSLNNGSPLKMKNNSISSQYQTSTPKNDDNIDNDLNPTVIAQEVVSLKREVQDLMGKIHDSIRSPELSPQALTIINKVKPVNQTPSSSKNKSPITPTQIEPEIFSQNNDEQNQSDINNILNHAEQKTEHKINENDENVMATPKGNENEQQNPPSKVPPGQLQLPLQSRNISKLKSAIKQIQNEIRELTQENLSLRKQLKEIKTQYSEAKSEVKKLESNLSRHEAIKMKMMQNYGKMLYQPADNDVVNTF